MSSPVSYVVEQSNEEVNGIDQHDYMPTALPTAAKFDDEVKMANKFPELSFIGVEKNVTCAGITAKKMVEAAMQAEKEEILPYSVITIDIQGMHQINSNYGISTGDKLLVKVSEILTRTIKDNGVIARWGNDEFIVLLPHVDAPTAEALANISKCEFTGVTVNGVPLRARFGFATRTDADIDLEELLRQAENKSQSDRV